MSNSNRESLGYIKEVTWGVNPAGNKQLLNFTQNKLSGSNQSQLSNFVRSDTNRTGVVRTGIDVGGDFGIELQYGAYDEFLQGALRGTFSTAVTITASTAVSASSADNSFNGTALFTNAVVGQYVRVSGFANAANNGYFRVMTVAANKITVQNATLVTESAGPAVTIKGSVLINGTTDYSFTFERSWPDISKFCLLTGLRVSEFNLNLATADISKGSFNFMGKDETYGASSGFSGSVAAVTTASMNTVSNVKKIFVDGAVLTTDITSIEFSVKTNAAGQKAIGSLNAIGVRTGSIEVTGTIGEYFEDTVLLAKRTSFTPIDMAVVIEDAAGNGYVFSFPELSITDGAPDNPGVDNDITVPLNFRATLDPTFGHTMSVSKLPA